LLTFGNELTNLASAPRSVTLTNTGTVALPIASITLSTGGSQPFSQRNTCGSSLAVGAACSINVVFNPASVGPATATLSINAGNGAGIQTVRLSGTGIVPTYTVSPTSMAFGDQLTNVASAPKSVVVTNTGPAALPIASIRLSPGSRPFSQINNCGSSLAAGAACTIDVVFDPASVGPAKATITIDAGHGAGAQIIGLRGTGVVPTYTASPASLTFGNQLTNVASAPPKVVTVTNTGKAALPIASIVLSKPFSQKNDCGSSVAAGAACTINVVFDPASVGPATAELRIDAGHGAGVQTVRLSGTGIVSTYRVSPGSVVFGDELTNVASAPKSVTVTNTGAAALPIASITLSTGGSRPFSQSNNCRSSLAAGAACTIYVVFDPTAIGFTTAALSINAGDGAGTQSVGIGGTGFSPTVTLVATPASITLGMSITLTWTSSNATACTAAGGQASAQVIAASPASSGGGGALDAASLLSLLTLIGLRHRRSFDALKMNRCANK
jgi:hypothetical protein